MKKQQLNKIKLVVGISDFRIGGAQKLLVDVLNKINLERFSVSLIVFVDHSENEPTFFADLQPAIQVHRLNFKGFKDFASWRQLSALLREIKPDVVWANLFFCNTVLRVLKVVHGYKVVSIEQNTYANKTRLQILTDRLLSHVTFQIVAVSKYVAEFTAKQESISSDKFVVINNGVDTHALQQKITTAETSSLLAELNCTKDNRLILNIGQFINQKNQELLIRSFAVLVKKHPEYRLVILGDGVLRKDLEQTVLDLDLKEKVFLPGIKKNVADYMAASEFFALSSRFEGFPIVVVEALACSLPLVSTPVSGSEEYLDHGKNGFLADETIESFSKQMIHMASLTKEEKNKFSAESLTIAKEFDIQVITDKYEELFKQALS